MLKRLGVLVVVLGLAGASAAAQSIFFPARHDFDAGLTFAGQFTEIGIRIATGDFNADGNTDVVLTTEFGELSSPLMGASILVYLGDGRGLFLPPTLVELPVNSFAGDVVTGNFNADANLDFAVHVENEDGTTEGLSDPGTGALIIFTGDGAGNFTLAQQIPTDFVRPVFTGIAKGNLASDGVDDLAVVNSDVDTVSVFLSSPAGHVAAVGSPLTTCNRPAGLDMGQLNSLPLDDLVVVCDGESSPDAVQIFSNNGAGVLTLAATQPAPTTLTDPLAVEIVDLNNDGDLDLAIANSFLDAGAPGGTVTLLKGDGVGGFGETFLSGVPVPVGDSPRSILAGDVDNDGDQDLVLANWDTDDVSVLVNTVTGTGTTAQPSFVENFFAGGIRTWDAAMADLDGIGNLDILATNANTLDGTLSAWRGGGNNLIHRADRFNPATGIDGPNAIVTADFDQDGLDDFAVANFFGDSVSVFRSTAGDDPVPAERFELLTEFPFPAIDPGGADCEACPFNLLAADIDQDTDMDILALLSPNNGTGQVRILRNNGGGSFSAFQVLNVGNLPFDLVLAPFDAGAINDLVVTNLGDHNAHVFTGSATGTFTPAAPATFPTTSVTVNCLSQAPDCQPTGVAAGDFNNDNNTDLAVSNFGGAAGGSIQIFQGGGDATFTQVIDIRVNNPFQDPNGTQADFVSHESVEVVDIDGVNGLDIVAVALNPDDFVSVLLNSGSNIFDPNTFVPTLDSPFEIIGLDVASNSAPTNTALDDVNVDGFIDLLVSGIQSNNVAVGLGDGTGAFSFSLARVPAFGAAKEANGVAMADIDGDGRNEALVPGLRLNDIAILETGLGVRADTDGNGRVDGFDLVDLALRFGQASAGFYDDPNLDGVIDGIDLAIIAQFFGTVLL